MHSRHRRQTQVVDGVDAPASDNSSQLKNELPRLQAMRFGELLDTMFSLYRAHFKVFLGIATLYFTAMLIGGTISFFDDSIGRDTRVVLWIVTMSVLSCISVFVVSAIVFASVQAYLDGKIIIGTVLRQAGRHFFRCFISAILVGLIVFIMTFLILLVFVGFTGSFVSSSIVVMVVALSIFLFIIFSAASSFVAYWCFYISTISVERATTLSALGRSDELIRNRWWWINGVMIAIFLLQFSIGFIFRFTFGLLLELTKLAEINEFVATIQWGAFFQLPRNVAEFDPLTALMYLINSGIDAFTLPIWVIGCTLLYFDQRIRKEGFDIEVMATRQGE